MSISTSISGSVYTITIGDAGTFSNEGSLDISTELNQLIAEAPAGDSTCINLEPGTYGCGTPILLASNTSVKGNDATLEYLPGIDSQTNWALLGNGNPGTLSVNISVQGVTCLISNAHIFGTWFIDAKNIDVQNNTYIGGTDGNAFVSVIDGLASNNVAIGQDNVAYDNWNGPVNNVIENNIGYVYGSPATGWNVLVNSSIANLNYTGDAAAYGIPAGYAANDGVINNVYSSNWAGATSVATYSLLDHGYTTETNITQQGNVTEGLGVLNSGGAYISGPMNKAVIQDDSFVGLTYAAANENEVINANGNNVTGYQTSDTQIKGNLVLGLNSGNSLPAIVNAGADVLTVNNANIGGQSSTNPIYASGDGTPTTFTGNITNSGNSIDGSGVISNLEIAAPPTLNAPVDSATLITGLAIEEINDSSTISVTLTTNFGTLSVPGDAPGAQYTSILGEAGLVLTGSLAEVNADLAELSFTSNAAGWDDAVEVNVTDSAGFSATRYIPVNVGNPEAGYDQVTTITPGEILPELYYTTIAPESTLSKDTVIASSGDNSINMGSTVSIVFIQAGADTVIGSSGPGYIATGSGEADINLTGGGDVSIGGGSGPMTVNAASGNNVVDSGASNALVLCGSGSNTVAGGLGRLMVQGGTGPMYIATLPQDGGNLTADLGSGNSTVLALSGNDYVKTQSNTENFIDLGIGNDYIASSGADVILSGSGNNTIDASAGGSESIVGGSGSLYFIGGVGDAFIDPAAQSTVLAGAGNLLVSGGGSVNVLQLHLTSGTSRVITLDYSSANVQLVGYDLNPIVREVQNDEFLNVTLSDGTQVNLFDPGSLSAVVLSGTLSFVPWSGISTPVVMNIGNMLETINTTGTVESQIIATAESGVPSGATAVLYTSLSSPGGLVNNGSIVLDPTNLTLDNPLTGDGVIEIDSGSILAVNGSVAATQTIAFAGTIGNLILGDVNQFFGTVSGFDPGFNEIDISNLPYSKTEFVTLQSGNVLDIIENGQTIAIQLNPLQSYADDVFTLSSDGLNGTSIADAMNFAVPSGATNLLIEAPAPGAETVTGNNSSNFVATFGSSARVIFNTGGSGTVAAFGTGDYVGLVSGNWSVLAGGGDSVDSSATNTTINTTGNANLIGLVGGSATVDAAGANDIIETFNSGVSASINVTGANENILVNGGADTVYANAGQAGTNAFFNQSGGRLYFINNSSAAASVTGGVNGAIGGSVTAFGGAGGGTYIGGSSGSNSLVGGTGLVTLIGSGSGNFLEANGSVTGTASNLLSVNNAGTSTLVASASTNWNQFFGGASGTTSMISAGSGQQNFFIGNGDTETITGSTVPGAVNIYHFEAPSIGGGNDFITNFSLGSSNQILIDEQGQYLGQVSIAGVETVGGGQGGTMIQLSDNAAIKLIGIYLSQAQMTSILGATGFQ